MAADIIALPTDAITVADQHLMYQIETDSTIDDAFRYVITVYKDSVSGTLLGKFYLTPNPQDFTFFNLAEAVRGLCQVDDRTYGGTTAIHSLSANYFTRSNGNIKKFVVGAGEWDGSTEALNDITETIYSSSTGISRYRKDSTLLSRLTTLNSRRQKHGSPTASPLRISSRLTQPKKMREL
jgi:hypothetical protein